MTATVRPPATPAILRRLDLAADDPTTLATVERLQRRAAVPNLAVRDAARAILDDVGIRREAAVADAGARFGGAPADGRLVIGREQLVAAADALPADIRTALGSVIGSLKPDDALVGKRLQAFPEVE